jgi:hypothetical protein
MISTIGAEMMLIVRPQSLASCPSLSADSTGTDDGYNTSNAPMTPREDDGDTSSRPMTPAYMDFDQAPKAPTSITDVEPQPVPSPDFDDLLLAHQHAMLQYADEYTPELADSLGDHCHETEDALRYKHHEMVQLVNDLLNTTRSTLWLNKGSRSSDKAGFRKGLNSRRKSINSRHQHETKPTQRNKLFRKRTKQ